MRNETASREIESLDYYLQNHTNDYSEESHMAMMMAIEALEQEPITWIVGKDNCQVAVRNMPIDKMQKICAIIEEEEQQPCDDCISREAVKKLKKYRFSYDTNTTIPKADIFVKIADIEQLPPVTPRPKGKWIQTKDDCDGVNFYDFSFECSKCGKEQSFKSNYCPNCGAYMRESEEEK